MSSVESDGTVTVGLDALGARLVADPEATELPAMGTHIMRKRGAQHGWYLKLKPDGGAIRCAASFCGAQKEVIRLGCALRRDRPATVRKHIFPLTRPSPARTINELVNNQAQITAVFAALADPTRRRILARLASGGEGPVAALSKPFRISPPAISRHLRVLEKARLIGRRRAGRVHLIRARPAGFRQAQEWMTHLAAGWNYSFDALDRLLINEGRKEKQK